MRYGTSFVATAEGIYAGVNSLKQEQQRQHEQNQDNFHSALTIALHTDSKRLWDKALWK